MKNYEDVHMEKYFVRRHLPKLALTLTLLIVGCGGGAGNNITQSNTGSNTGGSNTINTAPVISGTAPTTVVMGSPYSFTPIASDINNDTLTFSISNKPAWASFSTSTAALTGTPVSARTDSNIIITVSDGTTSTSLPAFSITVSSTASTGQTPIPSGYAIHSVNNSAELIAALNSVRANFGKGAIVLADGTYPLTSTLQIDIPDVMLLSASADPSAVILKGNGMRVTSNVDNLIRVTASGFVLDGITLQEAGNHLIQITAETNADRPVIRNCVLQDSYEQLLKVSYNKELPANFSDGGLVENCVFRYTQGIGPNFYIGGIDAHGIRSWTIRNNIFKDIASPGGSPAEFAIHAWTNASDNLVEGNVIIDSDRGIGFGMVQTHPNIQYSNLGGIIKNNIIYHTNNGDTFADVAIGLVDSANTLIEGNIIFMEHNYPNAIEYRFATTVNVSIKDNQTNKAIVSRNNGQATLTGNTNNLNRSSFLAVLNTRLGVLGLTP